MLLCPPRRKKNGQINKAEQQEEKKKSDKTLWSRREESCDWGDEDTYRRRSASKTRIQTIYHVQHLLPLVDESKRSSNVKALARLMVSPVYLGI